MIIRLLAMAKRKYLGVICWKWNGKSFFCRERKVSNEWSYGQSLESIEFISDQFNRSDALITNLRLQSVEISFRREEDLHLRHENHRIQKWDNCTPQWILTLSYLLNANRSQLFFVHNVEFIPKYDSNEVIQSGLFHLIKSMIRRIEKTFIC
jgi:hypothetical protein